MERWRVGWTQGHPADEVVQILSNPPSLTLNPTPEFRIVLCPCSNTSFLPSPLLLCHPSPTLSQSPTAGPFDEVPCLTDRWIEWRAERICSMERLSSGFWRMTVVHNGESTPLALWPKPSKPSMAQHLPPPCPPPTTSLQPFLSSCFTVSKHQSRQTPLGPSAKKWRTR